MKLPIERICLYCGEYFGVKIKSDPKKFCNSSCAASHTNKSKKRKTTKYCKRCEKPLINRRNIYCTHLCSSLALSEDRLHEWLSGAWDGGISYGLSSTIRNFLIKEAENRCTSKECAVPGGFSTLHPVTGKVPLEIDHIDGNSRNNKRENLRVLCPNCHSLTENFRALNKKSSRKYRKKYPE